MTRATHTKLRPKDHALAARLLHVLQTRPEVVAALAVLLDAHVALERMWDRYPDTIARSKPAVAALFRRCLEAQS